VLKSVSFACSKRSCLITSSRPHIFCRHVIGSLFWQDPLSRGQIRSRLSFFILLVILVLTTKFGELDEVEETLVKIEVHLKHESLFEIWEGDLRNLGLWDIKISKTAHEVRQDWGLDKVSVHLESFTQISTNATKLSVEI